MLDVWGVGVGWGAITFLAAGRPCFFDGGGTTWYQQCKQILQCVHSDNSLPVQLLPPIDLIEFADQTYVFLLI